MKASMTDWWNGRVWVACALSVLGYAAAVTACPAQAYTAKLNPQTACNMAAHADLVTLERSLSPSNETTVTAGAPVVFLGSSEAPVMFAVASSPALLSSPDIDSGLGSGQPEPMSSGLLDTYTFTSTKATAMARTVYWDASFSNANIPECAGMSVSTFTTEARALTVLAPPSSPPTPPSPMTAARIGPPEHSEVSLAGTSIAVQDSGIALLKLDCTGSAACKGSLTLTAAAKGRKRRATSTVTIGSASFSIPGDETKTVKIKLDGTGRALLSAGHGRLGAHMEILELEAAPTQTQSESVLLIQKAHSRGVKKK
ncbi:MAG: hypothetical protein ACRDLF_06400 [Solirubrobacteraceae bacterium]